MSSNKDKLRAWKAQNPPAPVPDRNKMVAALKAEVVPQLRKNGFSGSFPHFRRLGPTKTDCVTFQFDKWGGGFVVEIGEGPTDELIYHWGERIPAKKLTAHDLDLGCRTRLAIGPPSASEEWFRYDTGTDEACASAAKEVLLLLPQVEAWFRGERPQHNVRPLLGE